MISLHCVGVDLSKELGIERIAKLLVTKVADQGGAQKESQASLTSFNQTGNAPAVVLLIKDILIVGEESSNVLVDLFTLIERGVGAPLCEHCIECSHYCEKHTPSQKELSASVQEAGRVF